jgi:hypothetical protein
MVGAMLARAVCTVADLGVADHIEPGVPRSAAHLAKTTGANARSLYRVLRFLASYGLFREIATGEFDHTPLSSALRTHAEGSFRAGAELFHHAFAAHDGLDHAIRTGEPGFKQAYGKAIFDYLMEHPQLAPIFDAGMTCFHGFETGAMLDAYDFGAIRVLADIGGGNGSLLASVLARYPKLQGILFDLGHVVTRARESLKQSGLAERCRVIEGSFFEAVPPGADAYLLRHVLHDWTDEECLRILGHCRQAIPQHGRLLVVECVVPAGNARSIAKDFDVLMLNFPGGVERTEPEFRTLFEHAGFELESITPTSSMVSVLEGRPLGG